MKNKILDKNIQLEYLKIGYNFDLVTIEQINELADYINTLLNLKELTVKTFNYHKNCPINILLEQLTLRDVTRVTTNALCEYSLTSLFGTLPSLSSLNLLNFEKIQCNMNDIIEVDPLIIREINLNCNSTSGNISKSSLKFITLCIHLTHLTIYNITPKDIIDFIENISNFPSLKCLKFEQKDVVNINKKEHLKKFLSCPFLEILHLDFEWMKDSTYFFTLMKVIDILPFVHTMRSGNCRN